ncbi:hypothetical protein BACSTE_03255 [Bacteroides stercoris ATCC 43183]|uniref:Uncharacterized protein n=1 Tax=Bacteroides stercoris ATCC 43183 TaxID=449673 RepID=B0NUR8_BACSE|nr:hypothetical protein BACSTE_03255 [Bacteroides stercoris ATCC 43183]
MLRKHKYRILYKRKSPVSEKKPDFFDFLPFPVIYLGWSDVS